MTTAAITAPSQLSDLAAKANEEHAACLAMANRSLAHARNCGKHLLQAKALVRHGDWQQQWLADNFHASARTAQVCMRIARKWPEIQARAQGSAVLTVDQALKLISTSLASDEEDDLPDPTASRPRVSRSVQDPRPGRLPRPGYALVGECSTGEVVSIEPHTSGRAFYATIEHNGFATFTKHEVRGDLLYLQLEILNPRIDYDTIDWVETSYPSHSGPHPLHRR